MDRPHLAAHHAEPDRGGAGPLRRGGKWGAVASPRRLGPASGPWLDDRRRRRPCPGLPVGVFSWARSPGITVVSALFPIPKIALLPLFIIWFGIGEPSKVATIAFEMVFPTVISTFGAVDNVPRSLIRRGRASISDGGDHPEDRAAGGVAGHLVRLPDLR